MKKIITSAIILLLLTCCCVFASETCSLKVSVTDFSYSDNSLPSGGSLGVNCKLKQIYSDNQEYTFVILVTKNGEYFDHYETSGVLKNYIPAEISGSVSIPSDTSGVLVETFVWESLKSGKALAPIGVYNGALSSENSLEKLYVDGKAVEIEDNMVFAFDSLTHTPSISPVAKDSSAKVEIDAITTIPQDVNIKVTAQNGDVKNYLLSLQVSDGQITNAYQLNNSNSKVNMTTDTVRYPVYPEGKGPEDADDGYKTVVPSEKTQVLMTDLCSILWIFPNPY